MKSLIKLRSAVRKSFGEKTIEDCHFASIILEFDKIPLCYANAIRRAIDGSFVNVYYPKVISIKNKPLSTAIYNEEVITQIEGIHIFQHDKKIKYDELSFKISVKSEIPTIITSDMIKIYDRDLTINEQSTKKNKKVTKDIKLQSPIIMPDMELFRIAGDEIEIDFNLAYGSHRKGSPLSGIAFLTCTKYKYKELSNEEVCSGTTIQMFSAGTVFPDEGFNLTLDYVIGILDSIENFEENKKMDIFGTDTSVGENEPFCLIRGEDETLGYIYMRELLLNEAKFVKFKQEDKLIGMSDHIKFIFGDGKDKDGNPKQVTTEKIKKMMLNATKNIKETFMLIKKEFNNKLK